MVKQGLRVSAEVVEQGQVGMRENLLVYLKVIAQSEYAYGTMIVDLHLAMIKLVAPMKV